MNRLMQNGLNPGPQDAGSQGQEEPFTATKTPKMMYDQMAASASVNQNKTGAAPQPTGYGQNQMPDEAALRQEHDMLLQDMMKNNAPKEYIDAMMSVNSTEEYLNVKNMIMQKEQAGKAGMQNQVGAMEPVTQAGAIPNQGDRLADDFGGGLNRGNTREPSGYERDYNQAISDGATPEQASKYAEELAGGLLGGMAGMR